MAKDTAKASDSVRLFWDKTIILFGNLGVKPSVQRWHVHRVEWFGRNA